MIRLFKFIKKNNFYINLKTNERKCLDGVFMLSACNINLHDGILTPQIGYWLEEIKPQTRSFFRCRCSCSRKGHRNSFRIAY